MKKVVFLMGYHTLPVPSTMGGGVEELMTLLLKENEKFTNPDVKLYFIIPKLYGKEKKYNPKNEYKNSEVISVKYNRFLNFFLCGINKACKILGIKLGGL